MSRPGSKDESQRQPPQILLRILTGLLNHPKRKQVSPKTKQARYNDINRQHIRERERFIRNNCIPLTCRPGSRNRAIVITVRESSETKQTVH